MCLICDKISRIKSGENKHFVAELQTGFVVMADYQFFEGHTLFLSKFCVPGLHCLLPQDADKFLHEMSVISTAVQRVFEPKILNIELLGNKVPHLHWHIIPRYSVDPLPEKPIWNIDEAIWRTDKNKPSDHKLLKMKRALLEYLKFMMKKENILSTYKK